MARCCRRALVRSLFPLTRPVILLGTGRTTIYRLLADGTIKSAKIGKSRKIELTSALAVGGEAA